MKTATPGIQSLLNRCRKRLEKAQKELDLVEANDNAMYDTYLNRLNNRDAFLHIVREIEKAYGLEPKCKEPTLVEKLSSVLSNGG